MRRNAHNRPFSLVALRLRQKVASIRNMATERVLVIAAHPDDEVLGCGGTLAVHAQAGDPICVLILTDGGLERYGAETVAHLKTSARRAGEVLGYQDIRFLDLPDQRLDTLPQVEIVRQLEQNIDTFRPTTVYTHYEGDVNLDHLVAVRATMAAVRPVRRPWIRRVLSYPVLSSTEQGPLDAGQSFAPTVFVEITEQLEAKCRALACYETEIHSAPHPRSLEAIRAAALLAGLPAGLAAAEAFMLRRETRCSANRPTGRR